MANSGRAVMPDRMTRVTDLRRWLVDAILEHRSPIGAFVAQFVTVMLVTSITVSRFGTYGPINALDFYPEPVEGFASNIIEPLRNWDGVWYTLIALEGYGRHEATTAFWPFYPLLLRLGHLVTGWSVPVVGVIVSNLAFLGALVVLYRLIRIDYGELAASRTVWLLALFPTAFYFSAVYTEATFLLFVVASLYCGRTERWGWASVFGCLAALTRNTGPLLLIPLGFFLIRCYGWNPRGWWRKGLQLVPVALAPLLYLGYIGSVWGDPMLPARAQYLPMWDRYQAPPWETLIAAFQRVNIEWVRMLREQPTWGMLLSDELRHAFVGSQSLELGVTVSFMLLALYALWRVRPAYSVYAVIVLIIPLTAPSGFNPLFAMPRYVLTFFPLFLALGLLLRNRWTFGAILLLFFILLIALLVHFSIGFFVA